MTQRAASSVGFGGRGHDSCKARIDTVLFERATTGGRAYVRRAAILRRADGHPRHMHGALSRVGQAARGLRHFCRYTVYRCTVKDGKRLRLRGGAGLLKRFRGALRKRRRYLRFVEISRESSTRLQRAGPRAFWRFSTVKVAQSWRAARKRSCTRRGTLRNTKAAEALSSLALVAATRLETRSSTTILPRAHWGVFFPPAARDARATVSSCTVSSRGTTNVLNRGRYTGERNRT